jgi:hypothetical protein
VLIDVPRYKGPLQVSVAIVRWSRGSEFGMEFLQMGEDHQQQLHKLIRESEADVALRSWQRG